ncbi:Nif3-like dinuclear metal center hexameric protein [Symmachiella dynata]|uniref:Nif3-like dinuclear metal center hexameric protein n=1 Tax=Symmachiella dynata TaxID=2527995 RepID=UPI0030EB998A|tara:strand:+ start:515 stop:1618 length:1104 start_codon:yes stop_codon:yes gene_type:complete
MYCVSDIVRFLRQFAPPLLAEDWDNVGLLLGSGDAAVTKVMTCLTLTPDVAAEAIEQDVQLIVSHHPIMFRPIQQITDGDAQGKMLLDLIAAGIAVYSPHTSYDSAAAGINQQLAEMLDLQQIAPLRPRIHASAKIVCFVPEAHLLAVRQALWNHGAGQVGDYSQCSFASPGTGTFHGSDATSPVVGEAGRLEQVTEIRLEVLCPSENVSRAVEAMLVAHPYEEPAYDVYPLAEQRADIGAGRYGVLADEITLSEFNNRVKTGLGVNHLQFVGDPTRTVRRVAMACGAAAEFLRDGHRLGCDVLLTGEARFHDCLEARHLGMALVLPGHYASERPAMERLAETLSSQFQELFVSASQIESDPLKWDI